MKLKPNANIAIAGAGLLGRLLAWQLLEKGYRVTLYDAGSFISSPSAAYTAAGMIAPITEALDTEPLMYHMGVASLAIWPQWLQQLKATSAEFVVDYAQQGSLILAHQQDHSLLQQYQRDIRQQLPNGAKAQTLNQQQVHELEPDVSGHFQQGLYFPEEAHINNRKLLNVLLTRIKQLQGQCIENTAVTLGPNKVVETVTGKTFIFDSVLDCRGFGAKQQWSGVRGVRGEVLRVKTAEIFLQRPVRLLHPRYQLYVVPKPGHEFVIGATQIESEDTSPVSVQSALELNSALYTINPAFAEARIIEMQSNLRPALNDNRPQIAYCEGLVKVNGLYRHGYLLAPTVVDHTLSLLCGESLEKCDFSGLLYKELEHNEMLDAKAIA